jgi:hypothetical protein
MKEVIAWIVVCVVLLAAAHACTPRDDSDPVEGGRSGVSVTRDALTGCEYLRTPFGGITPRMDNTGKQVCRIRYTQELPLEGAP